MNVVGFAGSPRKGGNTDSLVNEILSGAADISINHYAPLLMPCFSKAGFVTCESDSFVHREMKVN